MGEDFRAWHQMPNCNWQSPNLNSSGSAKVDLDLSAFLKPGTKVASMNGVSPSFELAEASKLPIGQASEPHGWFYCLPRFRQAFTPVHPSDIKEKLPALCHKSSRESLNLSTEQKKFLVVDQSGDQTTLIFSSGVADPVHHLASWKRNQNILNMNDGVNERASKNLSDPILLSSELNENDATGTGSEMHEDTEELDALLYSDDDDEGGSTKDEDNDEVTSTGHSPSTMTSFDKPEWSCEGDTDEVASSAGSTKKRKLFEGGSDDCKPSVTGLARSAPNMPFESEDDAESSCGNVSSREIGGLFSNKKIKKEKIRETVSILQTIIPDGEGKDAIVVLDEAIQYLKTMKLKAKAFGYDSL